MIQIYLKMINACLQYFDGMKKRIEKPHSELYSLRKIVNLAVKTHRIEDFHHPSSLQYYFAFHCDMHDKSEKLNVPMKNCSGKW